MNRNISINQDLLVYLRRHHQIFFPLNNLFNSHKPHIVIDDRFYQIENNKKYLKKKLFYLIEEQRPHFVDCKEKNANAHKTIKYFLQETNKLKND